MSVTVTELRSLHDDVLNIIRRSEKNVSDLHALNKLFKGKYESRVKDAENRLQWWYALLAEEESKNENIN